MPLTPLHSRFTIAELLAVLRDQTGFEAWWQGMSEQARDDLTEELIDVLADTATEE